MNRYWDSVCFLGWFMDEEDKVAACEGVVQRAQTGDLLIVTSAITLTEVIKLKNQPHLKVENEQKINAFFQSDFIIVRNVDRAIAEYARELIWIHPYLHPKDSIHLATAIMTDGVDVLDTFDSDLLQLDGKVGNPGLVITKPDLPHQMELESPEE